MQLFLAPVHLAFAPEPSNPLDKFHVPNQHLVGKHVTIVNKSVWKDYEGIVKSVHSDGSALVEIQATMRQERLTMDLLKFGSVIPRPLSSLHTDCLLCIDLV